MVPCLIPCREAANLGSCRESDRFAYIAVELVLSIARYVVDSASSAE